MPGGVPRRILIHRGTGFLPPPECVGCVNVAHTIDTPSADFLSLRERHTDACSPHNRPRATEGPRLHHDGLSMECGPGPREQVKPRADAPAAGRGLSLSQRRVYPLTLRELTRGVAHRG
jgi:hypothetical protein